MRLDSREPDGFEAPVGRCARWLSVFTLGHSVFTLGHSVTLALSTLDLLAPRHSFVECAIAPSITYLGLENLTERAARPLRLTIT